MGDGADVPSPTPFAMPYPPVEPLPTPASTAPQVPLLPTPSPTPRKIPLRRSDSNGAQAADETLVYWMEEAVEHRGDFIADHLDEDEMMCIQHFDRPPTPTTCVCWIGPLEKAGVSGDGLYGMRRITIFSGSAEEAAVSLMEEWRAELEAAGESETCGGEHVSISYDGGLFQPGP